jgi:hypothetical protein
VAGSSAQVRYEDRARDAVECRKRNVCVPDSDPSTRNEDRTYQAAWRTISFGLIQSRDAIVKQLLDDKLVIHS